MLYSSLIKDTMTRKQPHFSERALGYSTFGDVLEEARNLGLLKVERDARSGGTWVVHGLGGRLRRPRRWRRRLPEAAGRRRRGERHGDGRRPLVASPPAVRSRRQRPRASGEARGGAGARSRWDTG